MSKEFTIAELEAYLDESLPPDAMAAIEVALRERPELASQLAAMNERRDHGLHTLGAIWRRHRVSCPSREQLGSYLLGVLGPDLTNYVAFHINDVGCRLCAANLADLQERRIDSMSSGAASRTRRYFQSSAGYLPPAGE